MAVIFIWLWAAAGHGAEVTHLVIEHSGGFLRVRFEINGLLTPEIRDRVQRGVSAAFTVVLNLVEVKPLWFDQPVADTTAALKIKFDRLRQDYRITRSWENSETLEFKTLEQAAERLSVVSGLAIAPLERLKKGRIYQLKVRVAAEEVRRTLPGLRWPSGAEWYSTDFVY